MSIYAKDNGTWVPVGSAAGGELPGLGGWATITEVSGTYTKHTYDDWVAFEWTADGSLKTQAGGLVDALVVGGGGCGDSYPGTGGSSRIGLQKVSTNSVVNVGQSTAYPNTMSEESALGSVVALGGFGSYSGAGGPLSNYKETYSITGIEVEYCMANYGPTPANRGAGAIAGVGQVGSAGVVIVRVPAANAQNVTENFFRWISYATVENGVVTKVTKTPDNKPYTASAQEVECDASVQEGYLYENGEFTAPKPDYSEEIEALTARLEELRNG